MAANYAPISLMPIYYNGKTVVGAKIYVYAAGTNTPIETFSDGISGAMYPWPMLSNSNGVIPPFWVGVTSIKVIITTASNVTIQSVDNIYVPSSASSSGGGTTPPPATDIPPGFMMSAHTTGAVTGWVRANGMTIGNATSGATERANADAIALFRVLWDKDDKLTVSGGRGSSADADFNAGKRINLPDYRGRAITGLDGMGNTLSNVLAGSTFTAGSAEVLGSFGGSASVTLTAAQMPKHAHAGSSISDAGAHTHTGTTDAGGIHSHTASTADAGNHGHNVSDIGHTHSEKGAAGSTSTPSLAAGTVGITKVDSVTEPARTTGSSTTGISIVAGGDHRHSVTVENSPSHNHAFTTASGGLHSHTLTIAESGVGDSHTNMAPFMLCTIYIKL